MIDLLIRRRTPACLAIVLSLTLSSPARVPTAEERVRDSTLSPDYSRSWRTPALVLSQRTPDPPLSACYRRDFELPAAPRHRTAQGLRP